MADEQEVPGTLDTMSGAASKRPATAVLYERDRSSQTPRWDIELINGRGTTAMAEGADEDRLREILGSANRTLIVGDRDDRGMLRGKDLVIDQGAEANLEQGQTGHVTVDGRRAEFVRFSAGPADESGRPTMTLRASNAFGKIEQAGEGEARLAIGKVNYHTILDRIESGERDGILGRDALEIFERGNAREVLADRDAAASLAPSPPARQAPDRDAPEPSSPRPGTEVPTPTDIGRPAPVATASADVPAPPPPPVPEPGQVSLNDGAFAASSIALARAEPVKGETRYDLSLDAADGARARVEGVSTPELVDAVGPINSNRAITLIDSADSRLAAPALTRYLGRVQAARLNVERVAEARREDAAEDRREQRDDVVSPPVRETPPLGTASQSPATPPANSPASALVDIDDSLRGKPITALMWHPADSGKPDAVDVYMATEYGSAGRLPDATAENLSLVVGEKNAATVFARNLAEPQGVVHGPALHSHLADDDLRVQRRRSGELWGNYGWAERVDLTPTNEPDQPNRYALTIQTEQGELVRSRPNLPEDRMVHALGAVNAHMLQSQLLREDRSSATLQGEQLHSSGGTLALSDRAPEALPDDVALANRLSESEATAQREALQRASVSSIAYSHSEHPGRVNVAYGTADERLATQKDTSWEELSASVGPRNADAVFHQAALEPEGTVQGNALESNHSIAMRVVPDSLQTSTAPSSPAVAADRLDERAPTPPTSEPALVDVDVPDKPATALMWRPALSGKPDAIDVYMATEHGSAGRLPDASASGLSSVAGEQNAAALFQRSLREPQGVIHGAALHPHTGDQVQVSPRIPGDLWGNFGEADRVELTRRQEPDQPARYTLAIEDLDGKTFQSRPTLPESEVTRAVGAVNAYMLVAQLDEGAPRASLRGDELHSSRETWLDNGSLAATALPDAVVDANRPNERDAAAQRESLQREHVSAVAYWASEHPGRVGVAYGTADARLATQKDASWEELSAALGTRNADAVFAQASSEYEGVLQGDALAANDSLAMRVAPASPAPMRLPTADGVAEVRALHVDSAVLTAETTSGDRFEIAPEGRTSDQIGWANALSVRAAALQERERYTLEGDRLSPAAPEAVVSGRWVDAEGRDATPPADLAPLPARVAAGADVVEPVARAPETPDRAPSVERVDADSRTDVDAPASSADPLAAVGIEAARRAASAAGAAAAAERVADDASDATQRAFEQVETNRITKGPERDPSALDPTVIALAAAAAATASARLAADAAERDARDSALDAPAPSAPTGDDESDARRSAEEGARREALRTEVRAQYRVSDDNVYFYKDQDEPDASGKFRQATQVPALASGQRPAQIAFRETDTAIMTGRNDTGTSRSMVSIAEAKGWDSINVEGDAKFRRGVWLEGAERGMAVSGYEPSRQDLELLAQRYALRAPNRITGDGRDAAVERLPAAPVPPDSGSSTPPAPSAGRGGPADPGTAPPAAPPPAPSPEPVPPAPASPVAPVAPVASTPERAPAAPASAVVTAPSPAAAPPEAVSSAPAAAPTSAAPAPSLDKQREPAVAPAGLPLSPRAAEGRALGAEPHEPSMRNPASRGASPAAVTEGTLVEHGRANYRWNAKQSSSYYVTVKRADGELETKWSKDLEKHMKDARADEQVRLTVIGEGRGKKSIPVRNKATGETTVHTIVTKPKVYSVDFLDRTRAADRETASPSLERVPGAERPGAPDASRSSSIASPAPIDRQTQAVIDVVSDAFARAYLPKQESAKERDALRGAIATELSRSPEKVPPVIPVYSPDAPSMAPLQQAPVAVRNQAADRGR